MPLFHAFTLGLRYDWLRENGLPGDDDLHGEVGEGTDHQVHNLRNRKQLFGEVLQSFKNNQ